MFAATMLCFFALAQQNPAGIEPAPATWADFYRDAATAYEAIPAGDNRSVQFREQAIFDWTSINEFHGRVFAWTEKGRPTTVATIFSFPLQDSGQRLMVREFASFARDEVSVVTPDGARWTPPPMKDLLRIPDAAPPPGSANLLKLHCRRLSREFSAYMYRREQRWDLRLLPKPLIEYERPAADILGGGLFAFVGYSTDPEILLLLEAHDAAGGPEWRFQAVRFSDKSLYLSFKDSPIWKSLRSGHGLKGVDTDDPHYRILGSERLSPEVAEKLSRPSEQD